MRLRRSLAEHKPVPRWRGPWRVTGLALLLLAGMGLAGWLLSVPLLVQPLPIRGPVRPSTILALALLGLTSLAAEAGARRLARIAAVLVALIGLGGVVSLLVHRDLILDVALFQSHRIPGALDPSLTALPLASALGFILAGVALCLITIPSTSRVPGFVVGILGAILVTLDVALILSYFLRLSPTVQFGPVVGSTPYATVGLLLVGLNLASAAWNLDWSPINYPGWVPVAAGSATLTAVLLLWRALLQGQRDEQMAYLQAATQAVQVKVVDQMNRVDLALTQIAWLSPPPEVGSARWHKYVADIMGDLPELASVAWVRPDGGALVLVPASQDSVVLRVQLGLQVRSIAAGDPGRPDAVHHFSMADSAQQIGIAVSRCDFEECDGFIVGMVPSGRLLGPAVTGAADGYNRRISWRGRALAGPSSVPEDARETVRYAHVRLGDMTWQLELWPTPAVRSRLGSGLPEVVLAFGLLVSALLPITLQLGRTVRSHAEAAEQVRLRLALGRSMDRAWSWDVAGLVSHPAEFRTQGGQEQRIGRWTERVHPDDRRRVESLLAAHLEGRSDVFEAQYRLRDESGAWHWRVDRGLVIQRGPLGNPLKVFGVSGDVSERRRVEQEKERSERRFQAVFDSAHQFEAVLDLEGRILEANSTALGLLKGAPTVGELRGTMFRDLACWPTAEVREQVGQAVRAAGAGRTVTQEVEIETASRESGVMDFSVKAIRDESGSPYQLLVEGRDITARRRAEEQLREVHSLTTMGRIAARVAHEINNPLAGIQNSFLLLRDAIPPEHPHVTYIGAMEREIARIARVTRQLYETYRPESNGSGHTGVRTLIGDAIAFLEQVNRPAGVTIEADLGSVPVRVPIPESVLRQSVYNLVQNAVEASPRGGKVVVTAAATEDWFTLRVRDQGPGVPAAMRRRIFEPFVSTKERSVPTGGMGIGLSLVLRSVQALGGSIEIEDPPGGGAEFVVRIPLAPATVEKDA